MKKRFNDKKLLLSKDTIRSLIPDEMNYVAGGICQNRISRGDYTACDCSGSGGATGTCGDCSTIQY